MRVFISWSGPKSRLVAAALHEWLDGPLNEIETFMSQEDIAAGENWSATIDDGLNHALFGIICATPENQAEPWLNYEAGAIAKAVDGVQARVVPLLIDFADPTELVGPLKKFQAKRADREGIFSVVRSINSALEKPREPSKLDAALLDMWPRLETRLKEISPMNPVGKETRRSEKDMVTEILTTVRDIARQLPPAGFGVLSTDVPPATKAELVQIRSMITMALDYTDSSVSLRHSSSNRTIKVITPLAVPPEVQSQLRSSVLHKFACIHHVLFIQEGE